MAKQLEYHGLTAGKKQPPEYQVWAQIKRRCYVKTHPKYYLYGDRGIVMCPLWKKSFTAFLDEVGERPGKGWSIERIDNSKGYVPGNVRWATAKDQARNRRTNRIIRVRGKEMTIAQAAEEAGMDRRRVRERLESGKTPDEAVSVPIRKQVAQ